MVEDTNLSILGSCYIGHEDTVRCIELLGNEVLPALRADQPALAGTTATNSSMTFSDGAKV